MPSVRSRFRPPPSVLKSSAPPGRPWSLLAASYFASKRLAKLLNTSSTPTPVSALVLNATAPIDCAYCSAMPKSKSLSLSALFPTIARTVVAITYRMLTVNSYEKAPNGNIRPPPRHVRKDYTLQAKWHSDVRLHMITQVLQPLLRLFERHKALWVQAQIRRY